MAHVPAGDSLEQLRGIGRWWGLILFFGIITIALGIVITFRPGGTVRVMAIIFGIWLLVLGIFRIIQAVVERGQTGGTRFGMAFVGLLAVLIGLLVLHHSFETVAILGFIVGLFWVVGGLAEVFAGLSPDAEGRRASMIVLGLLSAAIGVVCLIYPGLSLEILAVLLGIGMILYGLVEVALSWQVRKLENL